ncbi:hypothetical protein [Pedobacter borealis]|uniref:hypothetical protein n=1 Tax=Pedobacter borealis TaxID=475254 RepID=UPI0012FCF7C1|nr:hypothetical protein [Pedobacter borealis]
MQKVNVFFEAQSLSSYVSLFPCSAISFRCATGMPLRPGLNTSDLQRKPTAPLHLQFVVCNPVLCQINPIGAETKSFFCFCCSKSGTENRHETLNIVFQIKKCLFKNSQLYNPIDKLFEINTLPYCGFLSID